jgi:hypothetical protein
MEPHSLAIICHTDEKRLLSGNFELCSQAKLKQNGFLPRWRDACFMWLWRPGLVSAISLLEKQNGVKGSLDESALRIHTERRFVL